MSSPDAMTDTIPAAAAAASSTSASSVSTSSDHLLLRESKFYLRPPNEFVDDLLNASEDYLGYGCDEFEKSLRNLLKKSGTEISASIDTMYKDMVARLKANAGTLDSEVLQLLRLPRDIIVQSDMKSGEGTLGLERTTSDASSAAAAASSSSSATSSTSATAPSLTNASTPALLALQQRVASASLTNRALRTNRDACRADLDVYSEYESLFTFSSAAQEAKSDAIVTQVQNVAEKVQEVRTVHYGVTQQFIDVYGEGEKDTENELSTTREIRIKRESLAPSSSAAAASSSSHHTAATSSSDPDANTEEVTMDVTRQINVAAARMDDTSSQQQRAQSSSTTAAAASSSTGMNISEEAANQLF